ncbi:hypothetical protein M1K46_24220 [Fictibacillus sp. WQ 8-8]|uniref:hypothetical protein n=1 Tax=Fictibacillus sp. WQ 8-8 TaxID=2938788 RepID=UPI00210DD851|nr:hypothetical protein [Fictibacillus sp. WQ 8-8]MCQ6268683.1 hypothetical protein [Fictibacillus sp. WQ 8-8]
MAKVKAILDYAGKYQAAKSAASRMSAAKSEFTDAFDPDDLSSQVENLTILQKAVDEDLPYFTALGTVGAQFKVKYYDPAKAYITKYEKEVQVSVLIDKFEEDMNEDVPYSDLRIQYSDIKTALDQLPQSSMKNALVERLKEIIGDLEPAEPQSGYDSPDTGLGITLKSIKIEGAAGAKTYTIKYTEDNYNYDDLKAGQFKVYYKDGTSVVLDGDATVLAGDTRQASVVFSDNNSSEAYLIEYGSGLTDNTPIALGTLFWKVQPIDDPDEKYNDDDGSYDDGTEDDGTTDNGTGDGEGAMMAMM